MGEDDDFDKAIENDPVFIASQFRPGHILTEADVTAIQSVISEMDSRENSAVDAFHEGRVNAFREIDKYEVDGQPRKKPKGEPEAFMTIHMNGEDRRIVDAAKYDPRKTEFWSSREAQWAHVVTPLYPAED